MPNKVEFNKDYPSISKSDEYYKVAMDLIPCTTQTLAKGPQQNVKGVAPKYLQRGKGSHVWDVDGNEFIDYCCSWGPLILGHANENIEEAIIETVKNGTSFGAPTALENQLAELIISHHSYIEKIRLQRYIIFHGND